MERLTTSVSDKIFYFSKLSVIEALKTQQKLIRKMKIDKETMDIIKDIDLGGEGLGLETLFLLFVRLLQAFEPDELINFINEVVMICKVKVEGDNGEQPVMLNRDFEGNFNNVFRLMFEVIKANYDFSFFLTSKLSDTKPMENKNSVKVQAGQHI